MGLVVSDALYDVCIDDFVVAQSMLNVVVYWSVVVLVVLHDEMMMIKLSSSSSCLSIHVIKKRIYIMRKFPKFETSG